MKVKELVEWVAGRIIVDCGYGSEYPCPYAAPEDICPHEDTEICQWQRDQAKQILSHPDLALIDREAVLPNDIEDRIQDILDRYPLRPYYANDLVIKELKPLVIPLAEALKEDE